MEGGRDRGREGVRERGRKREGGGERGRKRDGGREGGEMEGRRGTER